MGRASAFRFRLPSKVMWDALADFRTALSYSHDNDQYQLRLVQALMMPGIRKESGLEARTYLLEREQKISCCPAA